MNQKIRAGLALLLIAVALYVLGGDEQTTREIATGVGVVGVALLVFGLIDGGRTHSDSA